MKKIILAISLSSLISPISAYAGGYTGLIKKVFMGPAYGSTLLIVLDRSAVAATCGSAADSSYSFYFDTQAPGGNVVASAVLAAYVGQKNVIIQGAGTCSNDPNLGTAEQVNLFRLE